MVIKIIRKLQCNKTYIKNSVYNYSQQTLPVKNASKSQPKETYSKPSSVPTVETISCDMIGPPHPISNLRPVIRHKPPDETQLQEKLRNLQNKTQLWNQSFWENHNLRFIKDKEDYIAKHSKDDQKLTADEMSDFYKDFLDKNWKAHVDYNYNWYKRNFRMLYLSIGVQIQTLFGKN